MTKKVKLYHFTGWPDFGVPQSGSSLLSFIQVIKSDKKLKGKTAVVHCSAGVGRTGTFIALHTLMKSVDVTKTVNIYKTVLQLREERVAMVQKKVRIFYLLE